MINTRTKIMIVCPVEKLVSQGLDVNKKLTEEQYNWMRQHTIYIEREPYIGSVVDQWEGKYKFDPKIRRDDILYVNRSLKEDLKRFLDFDTDSEFYVVCITDEIQ